MMFSLSISASAFLPAATEDAAADYADDVICGFAARFATDPQSIRLVVKPSAARGSLEDLADDFVDPQRASRLAEAGWDVRPSHDHFDVHVCWLDGECEELRSVPIAPSDTIVIDRGRPAIYGNPLDAVNA